MTSPTSQPGKILSPKAIETSSKLTPVAALAPTNLVIASPAIKKTRRCPQQVLVDVDVGDTKTHSIQSVYEVMDFFANLAGKQSRGKQQFVTVKGTGNILLKASISPDTPEIRKNLTWEAQGVKITSPFVKGDPLTASISRQVRNGIKIPVSIKVGKRVCKRFVVWIIWCNLTANIKSQGKSNFYENEKLGLITGNQARSEDQYFPKAGIEWTATIHPKEIITDKDRPFLEIQQAMPPPGGPALKKGVANLNNLDLDKSGFSGWDMSRQKCVKVFKGNDTDPDHLVKEVTLADNDPKDEPELFPDDPEGNDDANVTDEFNNPYSKNSLGILMSTDFPSVPREDSSNYNRVLGTGKDEDTYWQFIHFREFVRVQLGRTWFRCSDYGKWRWHVHMKRSGGQWNADPDHKDVLELNNNNFPGIC